MGTTSQDPIRCVPPATSHAKLALPATPRTSALRAMLRTIATRSAMSVSATPDSMTMGPLSANPATTPALSVWDPIIISAKHVLSPPPHSERTPQQLMESTGPVLAKLHTMTWAPPTALNATILAPPAATFLTPDALPVRAPPTELLLQMVWANADAAMGISPTEFRYALSVTTHAPLVMETLPVTV